MAQSNTAKSAELAHPEQQDKLTDPNIPPKQAGLLKTLWRGDAPLVITYWLFGFIGSLVIYTISTELLNTTGIKLAKLATFAFIVFYQVLVTVSIWRASKKYKGKRLYAVLAQTAVIVGWFSSTPKIILSLLLFIAE